MDGRMDILGITIFFQQLLNNINLTRVLLKQDMPFFAKQSVDPHQLASLKANWCGSALFVNKYSNLYLDQVIWLADNKKWEWHHNSVSMARVTTDERG